MSIILKIKSYFSLLCILYILLVITLLTNIATSNENNDTNIIIDADKILISNDGNEINASGNIKIETKEFYSTSSNSIYNKNSDRITSSGNIAIKDKLNNHYYFDHFSTDKNFGGPAKSRNIGIQNSTGEWISFLDADDFWFQNRLYYFDKFIKNNPESDVFCSNEIKYNIDTGKKNKIFHGPFSENFFNNLLINGNNLSPSATIVRRDFLRKNKILFDENLELIGVEDYDFWLNLARNNANFYFINKILNIYQIHKENISNNGQKHMENTINAINKNFEFLQIKNKKKLYSYRIFMIRFSFLINELRKKENFFKNLIKTIFCVLSKPIFTIQFIIKKII